MLVCVKCDFKCTQKSDWTRHIARKKHINNMSDVPNTVCVYCDKQFETKSKRVNHGKRCKMNTNCVKPIKPETKEVPEFNEVPESNKNVDIQQMMENMMKQINQSNTNNMEQMNEQVAKMLSQTADTLIKTMANTTINNNTIYNNNTTNNKFNLNIYLNTTCKDAINFTDFINSITVTVDDVKHVGTAGFVNGISDLIIQQLNALDITKRPLHCSDVKRETVHYKEPEGWKKDEPGQHSKMNKLVSRMAAKNLTGCNQLKLELPDCTDPKTGQYAMFNKAKGEALGGDGDREHKNARIIHKVCEKITIDKNK